MGGYTNPFTVLEAYRPETQVDNVIKGWLRYHNWFWEDWHVNYYSPCYAVICGWNCRITEGGFFSVLPSRGDDIMERCHILCMLLILVLRCVYILLFLKRYLSDMNLFIKNGFSTFPNTWPGCMGIIFVLLRQ